MIFRGVNSEGEWIYGKGKSDYLRDVEALAKNIETRIKEWKYDCFFATEQGVDYYNLLDRGTKTLLDSDIKKVILQTEGVLRIDFFESEINNETRTLDYTATLLSVFGSLALPFGG